MTEDRFSMRLVNAQQGYQALLQGWQWAKAMLTAGNALMLEIVCAKSREQEGLYHSCFSDLAKQCLYSGQKVDAEVWKRGLLQAFYEATKDDPDFVDDWKSRRPRMIPTLDGTGFLMLPIESKRFTKGLACAFITFVHSVGDERGVRWSKTSLGRDWPEEVAA